MSLNVALTGACNQPPPIKQCSKAPLLLGLIIRDKEKGLDKRIFKGERVLTLIGQGF